MPDVKDVVLGDRCYHPVFILVAIPIEIRHFVRVAAMNKLGNVEATTTKM